LANQTEKNVSPKSLHRQHTEVLAELKKYKLLIESIQDYAIFLLDKDGYVRTWNKGAEKYKGYKADEIIGKHFSSFYLERDKKAGKPERELEIAKKFGRVEDEDWRVRKDGNRFWANVVITALYDNGKLVGFAKVTRDLTERKQHEDALRNANILLKKQQKELERLSNSKDEFISLASHQLRTPATSIKQYLGMIIEGLAGEPNPDNLEFLERAYASNEYQLEIVNSLLKVAQIDAGKVILHTKPIDIRRLLRGIAEDHAENFSRRHQMVIVDGPKSLPRVNLDKRYFEMAIGNLVDNASKYTPDHGKIRLSARIAKPYLEITVSDNGVGIKQVDVGKLFQKFSRIHNILSDRVGGAGLGLYWVNKVIELHGGHVTVESEKDKGTTFKVYVPMEGSHA